MIIHTRTPVRLGLARDLAVVLRRVPDMGRRGAVSVEGGTVTGFAMKGPSGLGLIHAGVYGLRPCLQERFGFETDSP